MCMFCVIQKWSRRVATMLPWLVIPLIGLWALSQLLPPPFRFEVTYLRLACVVVLLVTRCWYEVFMPRLSAWRVRRIARLRERKRVQALELQKLKKTATRKCRNCLTPYRDQNPGGGKFMCTYCGHVSKRPVLDMPIPPGMGISNSGIIKDLIGKGRKILNGKYRSGNISMCNQAWLENGSWIVNGSFPMKPAYSSQSGVGLFGGSEPCLGDGAYFFAFKLSSSFLVSMRWLWRNLLQLTSSNGDSLLDAEHRRMLAKKSENGSTGPESRGEKARRKAEEKRQARLEKELLEEEERKQREEVARLVEERRRLRDEKIEAENRAKGTCSLREKDSKKEAEKRRKERRKDRDKGSNKSNSDVEELDKKAGKEAEWKRDTEKKSEIERQESPKTGLDCVKGHIIESGLGSKGNSANSLSRGNAGSRYFDRMKGTFLSSSRAFTGSTFFGKITPASASASATKKVKASTSVAYSLASNSRCDVHPPGKTIMNGDDKSNINLVTSDAQCKTAPKSWQQLFTRSSAAPGSAPSNPNVISRPSAKSQVEVQSSQPPFSVASAQFYDNPINLPSPFVLPSFSSRPMANSSSLQQTKDPAFPRVAEMSHDWLLEEPELFEDPCYEPDPVSLLGPVSESLDNFQLDLGSSYISDELVKSCPSINVSSPLEVSRPPIKSQLLRQRVADEKQNNPNSYPNIPKDMDMYSFPAASAKNVSDEGTWHMWNFSPLDPDGLSLVGGSASRIAPLEQSRLNNEEIMHYLPQNNMASLFIKDGNVASGTYLPQNGLTGNVQCFSPFGSSIPSSKDLNLQLQNGFSPSLSVDESHMPVSPAKEVFQKKMLYGNPSRFATNHASVPSTANCWSKNQCQWAVQSSEECVGNPCDVKSPIGGLFSPPDHVHSLW